MMEENQSTEVKEEKNEVEIINPATEGLKNECEEDVKKENKEAVNIQSFEGVKEECKETNNNEVKKKKVAKRDRVLSEGEASSGFETVSSTEINAGYDLDDDIDLSSEDIEDEEEHLNVFVQIENELAFKNRNRVNGEKFPYYHDGSDSSLKSKSDYNSSDSPNIKNNNYRSGEYRKTFRKRESRWNDHSSEKDHSRSRRSHDHNPRRSRERFSRRRRSRSSEERFRSRSHDRRFRYRSSDRRHRSRSPYRRFRSRSPYRKLRSRSPDRKFRSRSSERRSRRLTDFYKIQDRRDFEVQNFAKDNFGRSNLKRKFSSRKGDYIKENSNERDDNSGSDNSRTKSKTYLKKRKWGSASSVPSVWQRLEKSIDKRSPVRRSRRKEKERTPFLVELERKLKEAEVLKSTKTQNTMGNMEVSGELEVHQISLPSEPYPQLPQQPPPLPMGPPPNPPLPAPLPPYNSHGQSESYYYSCNSIPSVSLENLPLVPGPSGLPVHITVTGVHIPHDMDGRRIPVGPNGHFLPLDTTGRLFPHIVSPSNFAVPIHMSDDGILRLPNLEPVPVGPPHQLPVNIDGNVIPIGEDSRPLYPCPNLPKGPPLQLMQLESSPQFFSGEPNPPCTSFNPVAEVSLAPATEELNILDLIQNFSRKVNKKKLIKRYRKKADQMNEGALKEVEIQNNLSKNPSKEGIGKKNFKGDKNSSDSDMVLDSGDSDHFEPTEKPEKEVNINVKNLETKLDDQITRRIIKALKFLSERDFKPPVQNRFILSKIIQKPPKERPIHLSPLSRYRETLDYITPGNQKEKEEEQTERKKSLVTFRFGSLKKSKNESARERNNSNGAVTSKIFTFESGIQCDLTSDEVKGLSRKVSELEKEIIRLKETNASLLEGFRHLKSIGEKKSQELGRANEELAVKNKEIEDLRNLINKKPKLS